MSLVTVSPFMIISLNDKAVFLCLEYVGAVYGSLEIPKAHDPTLSVVLISDSSSVYYAESLS